MMLTCTRCGAGLLSGNVHYCASGRLLSNIPRPLSGPLTPDDVPFYSRRAMEEIVRRVRAEAVAASDHSAVLVAMVAMARAYDEVIRLCTPGNSGWRNSGWRMSIPADPTRDSDLIIADALDLAANALAPDAAVDFAHEDGGAR